MILNHAHVGKGEAAGHPFRGNQYTTAGGGGEASDGGGSSGKPAKGESLDRKPNAVGTKVKVTGEVSGKGKSGEVIESNSSGTFHVVQFSNGKSASYHGSDLVAKGLDSDVDDVEKGDSPGHPFRGNQHVSLSAPAPAHRSPVLNRFGAFEKGDSPGHPFRGNQYTSGGGGGAPGPGTGGAVGAKAADDVESAVSDYKQNIKDYSSKGDVERQEMKDFKADVKDATDSARAGDFSSARQHLNSAVSRLNSTPMTGLVNRLDAARNSLP